MTSYYVPKPEILEPEVIERICVKCYESIPLKKQTNLVGEFEPDEVQIPRICYFTSRSSLYIFQKEVKDI